MEAYRLQNQRSFDPMAAFLGGDEEVSAESHRLSLFGFDFLIDFNVDACVLGDRKTKGHERQEHQAIAALALCAQFC